MRPSRERIGSETSATPASLRSAGGNVSSAGWSTWAPPKSATIWIGPIVPAPCARAARSKPWRVSKSSGNCGIAPVPSWSESPGIASASMIAVAPIAYGSGCFMSVAVQRSQKLPILAPARPQAPDDLARLRHAVAEQRDQRRQQRDRGQHGDRDDDDRPDRHRVSDLRVDQEQPGERDDDGHAGEHDGHPGRAHGRRARLPGVAAGPQLLAVAGEDEQRVVDRDADAEHRGHVRDEDRHLHRLREQVDDRARDRHGRDAERQRQRGGGQRAEDDEQDQQHDRQADELGLLEVALGELLHAGPQPALADDVDGHGGVLVADAEVLAQLRGLVDRVVAARRHHERHDDDRPVGGGALLGPAHALDVLEAVALRAIERGGQLARVLARVEDERQRLRLGARDLLDRLGHGQRAGARDLEAAAGEAAGLALGERRGEEQQTYPKAQDETPAARDQALEPVHGGLHGQLLPDTRAPME